MVETIDDYYDEMDKWFERLSFGERISILSKYDIDNWYELKGETKSYIFESEGGKYGEYGRDYL